jgi:stage II sporulation protein GA (sporulation sigma-E factor processing peptidase)
LLLLSGTSLFFFAERLREERKKEELLLPVCLRWKGKEKHLMGLYDTGNQLVEPISGRPVHIAEYEEVRELMPESYQKAAKNYMETGTLDLTEVTRFQMYEFTFLSYRSIGQAKGQLLGIRMDSAVFFTRAGEKTEDKVVIGLSGQKLSGEGRYQMIINRRLGV